MMFIGFTGHSWTVDKRDVALARPDVTQVGDYTLEYVGAADGGRQQQAHGLRRRRRLRRTAQPMAQLHPAKFIYKKQPDSPTTEVAIAHRLRDDVYVIVGTINPRTRSPRSRST